MARLLLLFAQLVEHFILFCFHFVPKRKATQRTCPQSLLLIPDATHLHFLCVCLWVMVFFFSLFFSFLFLFFAFSFCAPWLCYLPHLCVLAAIQFILISAFNTKNYQFNFMTLFYALATWRSSQIEVNSAKGEGIS